MGPGTYKEDINTVEYSSKKYALFAECSLVQPGRKAPSSALNCRHARCE